jgi:hypothetical protein
MTFADRIDPATKPPPVVDERVRAFAASLSPLPPIYLPYTDVGGELARCHVNVQRHVREHGGHIVFGWTLWLATDHIQAEFHAVWMPQPGVLLDISPRGTDEPRVLFVEDRARWFDFHTKKTWSNRILMNDGRLLFCFNSGLTKSARTRVRP